MTINEYHNEREHYSSSILKAGLKSMKALKLAIDERDNEDVRKPHFDFGNAFELYLTNKKEFKENVAILNEDEIITKIQNERPELKNVRNSKEYKAQIADFNEVNADKYIISESDLLKMSQMAEGVLSNKIAFKLIRDSKLQETYFFADENTGVKLKSRPDLVNYESKVITDIKTISELSEREINKQINSFGYWLQALLQIEGYNSKTGDYPEAYFWLFVEKQAPYDCALVAFDMSDIEIKMNDYQILLKDLAECEKTGIWPGISAKADNEHGILTAKIW